MLPYNYISQYYKKSSITMIIITFIIFSLANAQLPQLNIFIAVQNKNQTYLSVLPYIDTCSYNQSDIIPGAVNIQPLSVTKIFQAVVIECVGVFWAPVKNGLDIALVFAYTVTNYTGSILYNSAIQNFNRQVIIYDISGQKLIFYYVLPTIDSQTLHLSLAIVDIINIDLPPFAQTILSQCSKYNSTISFIGNKTFLYLCSSSQSGFTFVPKDANSVFLVNTSKLQIGQYNLTTNPDSLNSYTQFLAFPYNSILLITNQQGSYLYFVLFENQTLAFIPIVNLQEEFIILIDRIWGQEFNLQIPKWMDIYKTLSSVDGLFFPGDIVSVYVDQQQDIFIQSQSTTEEGKTYLTALNNIGNVYWNVSFHGQVFLYSSQIVFIYNQQKQAVSTLQVERPIYPINVSNFQKTTPSSFSNFSLKIQCSYVNISINYRIYWTTPDYPSAYVQQICDTYQTSNFAIYGLLVSQNYLVVGPDLQLIPDAPNNLEVFTIDKTSTVINNSLVGVVGVWVESDGSFQMIIATNTTIYQITFQNQISVIAVNPCGFYVITSAVKIAADFLMISNENNQTCICNMNFTQCKFQNKTSTPKSSNSSFISSFPNDFSVFFNPSDGVLFKKNLYALIKNGYIITILQNNSAVLVNIIEKVILDIVELNCSSSNSTNGLIHIAQFQSPVLILFCQGSPQLFQYLISNNSLKINRVIPLYEFTTRPGQINLQLSENYAFLEVDPINLFSPQVQNCCVLKLNFSDFTISVINQVIYAKSVITYGLEGSYNFVVLSSVVPQMGPQTIVTLYFMNEWITFNQTDHFEVVDENLSISINFYSFTFNFAVQTQFYLTFNLTNLNLKINKPKTNRSHEIQPIINFSPSNTTGQYNLVFNATVNYNLSQYVCGPVFHNFFIKNTSDEENLLIYQRDILIPSKLIGQIGVDDYIQILNPQDWQQYNFSMNNLLLIVGADIMYVYAKTVNNVQLVNIANITLSETSCQYYLYNVINQTAVTLNSECSGFNTSKYNPYLIINYDPINSLVTYFISESITGIQLRNTFTFPGSSQTLIIGVLQGPLSTLSGRLVICSISNCSYLYISNSFSFLLDYSALQIDNTTFYITVIDVLTISVFISPEIQPPNVTINPNYIFNYNQIIDEPYCSMIKIINATQINSYVILSCTQYYYVMLLDFVNQLLSVAEKFSRYSNCALFDNFRPQIIKSNEGDLAMFITQCRIDDLILKIKVYQGISNKSLPVHTGYLQIFTLSGPLGPNCSSDSISPTKIVTLWCSMDKQLIKIYSIGQTNKFMYSQINGILIDNFIEQVPQVQLTYRPESQIYTFPTIELVATNQFHTVYQPISTEEQTVFYVSVLDYIIFIMYISANFINLLFIICFFIQKKSMKERIRLENLIERQKNQEDLSESDEKNHHKFELFSRSLTQTIKNVSSSIKSKSQPKSKSYQMELHFFKKPKRFS